MRVFPIYESCQLFNTDSRESKKLSRYICMSADDAHIVVTLHKEKPINIRWFTDANEYKRFINNIKKSYKHYEEDKEIICYCRYPSTEEFLPF